MLQSNRIQHKDLQHLMDLKMHYAFRAKLIMVILIFLTTVQ